MIYEISKCTKRCYCGYTRHKGFILAVSKIIAHIVNLFLPKAS